MGKRASTEPSKAGAAHCPDFDFKIVYDTAKDGLVHWLEKDGARAHVNALRDKIANAVLSRVAARQTLENKRKAASISSTGMPDKLADCRTLGPQEALDI